MDLQWWMLLPLIPLAGIAFVVFKIIRVRRRGRAFLQLSKGERLEFARLVVRDGSLPLVSRTVVGLSAAYLALPINLIPNFVPIVGHADDFLVVTLMIAILTRHVPPEQLETTVSQARLSYSNRNSAG